MPSGFTPTELFTAHRAGAPLVKLFPSAPVGPAYLKYLRGPFPDFRIIPTGGKFLIRHSLDYIRAQFRALGKSPRVL